MMYVMGKVSSHEEEGTYVADVVPPAVAKAVALGLRPPWHPPPLLPAPPPAPPTVKRERQPDADDDDAKTKQRGRRYRPIPSTASSSSAFGGQAPMLSKDDMDMIHHFQLDHEASKMLKQLSAAMPSEKIALISKLQKNAETHDLLRNPSAFVITCCKNALGQ
jgi:hypothetical protein